MKNIVKLLLPLVVALVAVACATVRVAAEPPQLAKEQTWQLVAIQGRAVNRSATPVTIVFNPETGNISGRAACNTYSATYSVASGVAGDKYEWCRLEIGNIGHADMQCPDAEMNAEMRYLALLKKCTLMASPYPQTKLLLGNNDKVLLEFELQ